MLRGQNDDFYSFLCSTSRLKWFIWHEIGSARCSSPVDFKLLSVLTSSSDHHFTKLFLINYTQTINNVQDFHSWASLWALMEEKNFVNTCWDLFRWQNNLNSETKKKEGSLMLRFYVAITNRLAKPAFVQPFVHYLLYFFMMHPLTVHFQKQFNRLTWIPQVNPTGL